ncbi:hypothetical protein HAX54_049971, partial [Datura stramonium]|nr:hypothetical protein [Datura stramonium]
KIGKIVSQQSSGKGTRLPKQFPTKKIASSSKRRLRELIDKDVPEKSVDLSKSKPSFVSISRTTEGPSTSTDTKSLTREERQVMLKLQKVLRGRVFDPEVRNLHGMADLVKMVVYQELKYLLYPLVPNLHEKEVRVLL